MTDTIDSTDKKYHNHRVIILKVEMFNRETTPKRLGNWEVPRWSPSRPRPEEYRPNPKPICDMNGHFLPGAPRGTSKCFGHYTGTWDLPRKITRKVAEELAREPPPGRFRDWFNVRVQRPKRLLGADREKVRKQERQQKTKDSEQTFRDSNFIQGKNFEGSEQEFHKHDQEENQEIQTSSTNEDDPLGLKETKVPVDENDHAPYIPGSLTEPDKRHDSYDILLKKSIEDINGPQEDDAEKFWRKVYENAKNNDDKVGDDSMKYNGKDKPLKLPEVKVSQNFQFAKKMHVGNLEHQPLPDTLGYRDLTKIGEHRDSDIIVKPYAIGWKGFGASGPTCCTKMRIHRPKTCDSKKIEAEKDGKRPATSIPDLGGQYKKQMSLMDLAICWDFRPDNPKAEPRPPKHIDGSNGSKAPAVFTMVHTPNEEVIEHVISGHSNPIFTQNEISNDVGHHSVPYFEKDMTKEKRKDSCDVQYCPQHNGHEKSTKSQNRRNSAQFSTKPPCDGIHGCGTPEGSNRKSTRDHNNSRPEKLQPVKEAWNCNDKPKIGEFHNHGQSRNSLDSYEKTPLAQGKLHQSSPNESQLSRRSTKDSVPSNNNNNTKHKHCLSCNGTKVSQEIRHKEEYKSAFKAGNPNSGQNGSSSVTTDSKGFKIPKMRHPYSKKSYTIPTLAPPFSIWKDANATGYPEHWRLASVYQHAYKPLEQRRKPLISGVYQ